MADDECNHSLFHSHSNITSHSKKKNSSCCHDESLELTNSPLQINTFLSEDDGMFNDSRYLATVRRATSIPSSFNKFAIALSDNGLRGFSTEIIFLIMARIAVDEHSPPVVVPT